MGRLLLLAAAAVTLAGAGCKCCTDCFGGGRGRDCEAGMTLPPATTTAGGPGVVQSGANKPAATADAGMTQAGFRIQGAADGCADGK